MRRNLLPILALLCGTLLLFLGNGLQSLLLPVRGAQEGYSNEVLGLLGTTWASGFVIGCFVAPNVVRRIGHVRAFSGFLSLICLNVLLTGLMVDQNTWLVLRAITGFCTAGTSMIIESWLNERATSESRGTIFSFYISITLFGVVGGQLMVPFADIATPTLFMICGIFYSLAALPTTLSKAASPQPLEAGAPGSARPLPQFPDLLHRHPPDRRRQWRLWHARRGLRHARRTRPGSGGGDGQHHALRRRYHAVSGGPAV